MAVLLRSSALKVFLRSLILFSSRSILVCWTASNFDFNCSLVEYRHRKYATRDSSFSCSGMPSGKKSSPTYRGNTGFGVSVGVGAGPPSLDAIIAVSILELQSSAERDKSVTNKALWKLYSSGAVLQAFSPPFPSPGLSRTQQHCCGSISECGNPLRSQLRH